MKIRAIIDIHELPIITCENPYIISCDAIVHGDPMTLQFIGDYARARVMEIASLRPGDTIAVSGEVRGKNILVEELTLDSKKNYVGRNLNVYM